MKKRKIIKLYDGYYMSLKPLPYINDWENIGRKYTSKGLISLLKGKTGIEFTVSNEIQEELKDYIIKTK